MFLGIASLLTGLVAAGAGAYLGFTSRQFVVALPAGLPATEPVTMAIWMIGCGIITMLLGVASIYRANEY